MSRERRNARTTVPVRVRGRIVTILTGEASITSIVQITKTPRAAHTSGVRPIERRGACIDPIIVNSYIFKNII